MRRISILITSFVLVLSGLEFSPANAVSALADGTYDCNTGFSSSATPNYTITSDVVSLGTACVGVVAIPEGVTNIGTQAFEGATAVTAINLPLSLTNIEPFAFAGTTSISSIFIPKNVSVIIETAFLGMTSLSEITVDAENTSYASDAGVLFSASKAVLYVFPAGKVINGGIYSVPNTVNYISSHAFRSNGNLVGITIPASVTGVGILTFAESSIRDFFFEGNAPSPLLNSFRSLTANAYVKAGASGFTPIELGKWNGLDVTTGFPSLLSCGSAGYFKVTNNAVTGNGNCAGEVNIPDGVTTIGFGAFYSNQQITSVTIPASVTLIGTNAFWGATSLTSVTFATGSKLTAISDTAFREAALQSITIPVGVETIGASAFRSNGNLSTVTFMSGSKLTYIGPAAFRRTQISTIYLMGDVAPSIDVVAFESAPLITEIGVEPTPPTRTGYTFNGWSATFGGPAVDFPYVLSSPSTIILYALWTRDNVKASAITKPYISGTAKSTKKGANKLTAKSRWSGYPNPAVSYQWYSCTAKITSVKATIPGTCKKISRATKSTLALTKKFKGKYIAVAVTGRSTGTAATKWLSKSTARVK